MILRPLAALVAAFAGCASAPPPKQFGFEPLPWTRQLDLREGWLRARQALLLDMMRRHGVAMWIVVNVVMEEDPVYLTDAGWRYFIPRQTEYLLIR